MNTYPKIAEHSPPGRDYARDGGLTIYPLDDEPGCVHVMLWSHGEILGVVLDEAGARQAAALLLAPFAPSGAR